MEKMAEDDSELKDHTRMHKRAKVVHSAEASAIEISRIRERDGDGFGTGTHNMVSIITERDQPRDRCGVAFYLLSLVHVPKYHPRPFCGI